jgi:hypothetical protein
MFFDGSDVGITRTIIDGMDIQQDFDVSAERGKEEPMDVLLSFNIAHSIPPIGLVLQSDIIRFVAESNGAQTDGEFERFFDGSDIGLTAGGENVDAFVFEPYFNLGQRKPTGIGNLYFSTSGNLNIPDEPGTTLQAKDEDIVVCWGYDFVLLPTGDIQSSCQGVELFFDGSEAGLNAESEDVDAFALGDLRTRGIGDALYLSTRGNFSITGVATCAVDDRACAERVPQVTVSGRNEDVFRCVPDFSQAARGGDLPITGCLLVDIAFDGSDYNLGSNNVYSIDLLEPECIIDASRGRFCTE